MLAELLPFQKFFWDCDFSLLTWEDHRNFIIRRLLTAGDGHALCWLRTHVGEEDLRIWIIQRHFLPQDYPQNNFKPFIV